MKKVAIIIAKFYGQIAEELQKSAVLVLDKAKMGYDIYEVPGCFELPAAAGMIEKTNKYEGIIALGCVIRGETTHYQHVCEEASRGLNHLAIKKHIPLGFGVITAENMAQAERRASSAQKNMGGKAAEACLRMMALKQQLGLKQNG